jgi:monovalent cation:H+ antiporter-2, CPA2 family
VQEDFRLIVDLVLVLAAAAAGGLFASLLRQPVILGYLLGGMVVGPTGLGLIKELIQVETLAQFGVAFLLFALGVEFSFAELKRVKVISLGGGGLQMTLTILVTALISLGMGWCTSWPQGIFLGAILSLSSTAVVLKCLMERNEASTPHGQVMLGILVVQDLALGLMLAVLPALHQPVEAIGGAVAQALLRITLFAIAAVIAGKWLIPPLLRFLAKTESRELFLLGVVVLALGIALLTEYLGFSIEMGAFVAGLMVSEVEYADQTLTYVEPLRDIFASLFFVSVGMLIDPLFLWNHLELILGLVSLVLIGKFLIVTPIVKLFGYPLKTALIAGVGLAQIGEFSFVLASAGQTMGLIPHSVYLLIVGTAALTLVLTPFMLRLTPQVLTWAETFPPLQKYFDGSSKPLEISENLPLQNHLVICGYGQVGQNLVRLLQSHNFPVVVIDQSEAVIQECRTLSIPYLYGNAASLHVLEAAGIDRAKAMAIALPDSMSSRLCLKRALELAPDLDIVVRANHDKDIELFYQLGAWEVVQPEFEASLELSSHLLISMGWQINAIGKQMQEIRSSRYLDLRPLGAKGAVSRDLKNALQELNSKWYSLPENSPLIGMTLEDADLRRLTGVSLIAIRREQGAEIDYPDSEAILEEGDRVLLVGEPEEMNTFECLAKGEVTLPEGSTACQWLRLPLHSSVVGQKLSEIDLRRRYGVQIHAIRRDGKFIRWPHGDIDLQGGDRLLLCGNVEELSEVCQWLVPLTTQPLLKIPVVTTPVTQRVGNG